MINRLSVLCFAGTYALALVSDLSRFVVRIPARWHVTLVLTLLGWLVQAAYLGNWAWRSSELPTATVFGSLLVLAWVLTAIDLYLTLRAPHDVAVGAFHLPLVLFLLGLAGFLPKAEWTTPHGWFAFWGVAHGSLLLGGAVATCVAFATGLMFLAQSRRLKRKRPPRFGFALPSLEQSERVNRGAITLAFPLLTAGLLIGVALSFTARAGLGGHTFTLSWADPKVISAIGMWLVFAVLLHARFRPELRGRSVMLLTVIAFAFLVFTWVGVEALQLPTAHGAPRTAGRLP